MFKIKDFSAKDFCIDVLSLLVGSILMAVSIDMFSKPNNIAPGGFSGIATMVNYATGWPTGIVYVSLNIPVIIWAIKEINFQYIFKTGLAVLFSSIAIDAIVPYIVPMTDDKLLAAIFGGAIGGAGLGLIFMRGATTGGTDLLANLIGRHLRHISIGKIMLFLDSIIVISSAFVYKSILTPMYAIISIFVCSKLIDAMLYGSSNGTGKLMIIVSIYSQEISDNILKQLERGVTKLKSRGGYLNREGEALMCAVSRSEVYKVYGIVSKIDPHAFIVVTDAGEIRGEGFDAINNT